MNKKELINSLLKNDLNKYQFSVYATFTDDEIKYSYCLKGSKPQGYEHHLIDLGGVPCLPYTFDLIDDKLTYALDYKISEIYS